MDFVKTYAIEVVLFSAGTGYLYWNESNAKQFAKSLNEAYEKVKPINARNPIDTNNDGKIIHISGKLDIKEDLVDTLYSISIKAVKLRREIETFQWTEEITKQNLTVRPYEQVKKYTRKDTNYYYIMKWMPKLVDSSQFKFSGFDNPLDEPKESYVKTAPSVKIGTLSLGDNLIKSFNKFEKLTCKDALPDHKDIKLHEDVYYHCANVQQPENGEFRVKFSYCGKHGDPISIIAVQENGYLVPYITAHQDFILSKRFGILSKTEMYIADLRDEKYKTWKRRAIGVIILWISMTRSLWGPYILSK